MNTPALAQDDRPAIHLDRAEHDTLSALALAVEGKHPVSAALLLSELDRATLCDPGDLPDQTVTMQSTIHYVDEGSGQSRTVKLVYPQDADVSEGRISVLTPIGAALIGMGAGAAIQWPDRHGRYRTLRIASVEPARNG